MMKLRNLAIALSVILIFQSFLPHISSALDIDVFATIDGLRCNGSSGDPRFTDAIVVRLLSGGVSNTLPTQDHQRNLGAQLEARHVRAHAERERRAAHRAALLCFSQTSQRQESSTAIYTSIPRDAIAY